MKRTDRVFHITGLALFILACALAALVVSVAPPVAEAEESGPFVVEGPSDSYRYDDSVLVISGEGVTIQGMDGSIRSGRNIKIETGVTEMTIVSGVEIDTLNDDHSTTLTVQGDGNSIAQLENERDMIFKGSGSTSIGVCTAPIEVAGGSVTVVTHAGVVSLKESGTFALAPGAKMAVLFQYGGTLDLSLLVDGGTAEMVSYLIAGGTTSSAAIIVPFGTADLSDLITADNRAVEETTINVYSNGEQVGVLQQTGNIYYTATREVTFVGLNGQVLKTETVRLFEPAQAPEVAEQPGYEFVGWDLSFDRITENMTVAALFESTGSPANPGGSDAPNGDDSSSGGNSAQPLPTAPQTQPATARSSMPATGDTAPSLILGSFGAFVIGAGTLMFVAKKRR